MQDGSQQRSHQAGERDALSPLNFPHQGEGAERDQRIPVSLEVPAVWFGSSLDGPRHQKMFAVLCTALARRAVSLDLSIVPWGSYRAPRKAPSGGVMLSFHSIGDAENVWRIKETPIVGWYSFDENGFSGWSSLGRFPERHVAAIDAQNSAFAQARVISIRNSLRSRNASKYVQSQEAFSPGRPFVYFPMQLLEDPVSEMARLNALEVLAHAASLADSTGMLLVVKRHPLCRNPLVQDALNKAVALYRNVMISTASVHQHLDGCSSVIVANSGVGLEALLYGKPVFSFAASEYELATFPIDSLEQLSLAFSTAISVDADRIARFVAYYLDTCCFSIDDEASVARCIDRALSVVGPRSFGKAVASADTRHEINEAYAALEAMRRAVSGSMEEFERLKGIASQAVERADALDAEHTQLKDTLLNVQAIAIALHSHGISSLTRNAIGRGDVAEAISGASSVAGNWLTNTGQSVLFNNDLSVSIMGQKSAEWLPLSDGSAVVVWEESGMIDVVHTVKSNTALEIRNIRGEQHEVSRGL